MYPFDSHVCTFQVGSCKKSESGEIILREIFSDFYDRHSMTCSSALFDPSVESDFVERNLQHHVGWRKLSSEKNVVRLTSGSYSACGFEILLKRKHEPFMYQVELN